jgi:hypothetical protein
VQESAGSKRACFCGWHRWTGHGRQCTQERLLSVSICTVWVTAGVPSRTVTTYSKVPRGRPDVVGTSTSPFCLESFLLMMASARTWSRRSTSGMDTSVVSEWNNVEHGVWR